MSLIKNFWLKQMDKLANASPPAYYAFVWFLSLLGFAYLILFPAAAVLSLISLIELFLAISPLDWQLAEYINAVILLTIFVASLAISWATYQAKPDLPAGKPLTATAFPDLFDRIKELRVTFNAPDIDAVKITTRCRIELVRTPKRGFPLNYSNTLLIGLPVLSVMSPLHLKLLLARNIGHAANCKKSHRSRVTYLRGIWENYETHYKKDWRPLHILHRLFFAVYSPFFRVTTRAAMRLECFTKDSYMLDVSLAEHAAEAIAVFSVNCYFIENTFWPELNNMAYKHAKPQFLPYTTMARYIAQKIDETRLRDLYQEMIELPVVPGSKLPKPNERMEAIGFNEFTVTALNVSAANHFLGKALQEIQKQLDNVWYLQNRNIWNLRHQKGIDEKKRLQKMRKQAAQALLSNEEAKEYLLLLDKYAPKDKVLPLYKEIYKTNAHDPEVSFHLGRLFLEINDNTGVKCLQIAMDTKKELFHECCHLIITYADRVGDTALAKDFRRKIVEHDV